jgi:hypothetical protein
MLATLQTQLQTRPILASLAISVLCLILLLATSIHSISTLIPHATPSACKLRRQDDLGDEQQHNRSTAAWTTRTRRNDQSEAFSIDAPDFTLVPTSIRRPQQAVAPALALAELATAPDVRRCALP